MAILMLCFALMLCGCNYVSGQDALIGEHVNATHFAKEYTDIQTHISSAIMSSFKHIRIAEGTYFIARSVFVTTPNITISGIENKTTLFINSTRGLGLAMIVMSDTSNVSVANLMLNGYNNASRDTFEVNGIAYVNVSSGLVDNVRSENFRNGMFVNHSSELVFENVHVSTSQYDGWLVRNSSLISINASSSLSNGRRGIALVGNNTYINITNSLIMSHITDNNCGIRLEHSEFVFVVNNTITNNKIGLCLKSVTNIQLLFNTITGINDAKCIYISDVSQGRFVKNECNTETIDPLTPPPPVDSLAPLSSKRNTPSPSNNKHTSTGTIAMFSNSVAFVVMITLIVFAL